MKNFDRENPVKNLPDYYYKSGNNEKILQIEKISVDGVNADIEAILNSLDLSQATGKTLDLLGETVNQVRAGANDIKYRLTIRAKIMRNFTNADYNSLIRAIAFSFGCDVSEINITEAIEPCTVEMVSIPLDIVEKAQLSQDDIVDIVMDLLPVGVGLKTFLFAGTFEFAENENVASDTAGFANDEQTIGGHFGNIAS